MAAARRERPVLRTLTPIDKAMTIGTANLVVLAFALFSSVNEIHSATEPRFPNLAQYYWLASLTAVICFLPSLIIPIVTGIGKLTSPIEGEESQSPPRIVRWIERQLNQVSDDGVASVGGNVFLIFITSLSYVTITTLVLNSGGPIQSPYQQFPVALVLIAPIIMTGSITPRLNLVVGLLYTVLIYYGAESSAGRGLVTVVPNDVMIATHLYVIETALIISVSLIFNILRSRRRGTGGVLSAIFDSKPSGGEEGAMSDSPKEQAT